MEKKFNYFIAKNHVNFNLCTFFNWRRKWQSTPVLLPGKFHGWKSLVGYSSWGCKESDTTECLHFTSLICFNIAITWNLHTITQFHLK